MLKFGTPTIALPLAIKKCTVQAGCTVHVKSPTCKLLQNVHKRATLSKSLEPLEIFLVERNLRIQSASKPYIIFKG